MKPVIRKTRAHRALAPHREYFVVCCGWLLLEKIHCSSGFQKQHPAALKTQIIPDLLRTCAYEIFQAPPQANEKFSRL